MPNDAVTTYYCQMFKIPSDWLTTKRHLVRVINIKTIFKCHQHLNLICILSPAKTETLMNKQSLPYNHHWLMYECPPDFEDTYLANNTEPEPHKCTDNTLPWRPVERMCSKISLGWAVGGDLVNNTGFLINHKIHSI